MSQGEVVNLAREAMMTVLLLSAPMLGVALLVGILVSVFQATTSIQEATLAFVPKIVAVLVSFIIFGPWVLTVIVDFTERLLMNINTFIN